MSGRMIDRTKEHYEHFIVLEPTDKRIKGSVVWKCQCECGNIFYEKGDALKRRQSCGCIASKQSATWAKKIGKNNIKDLTGQTFGRLTVLEKTDKRKHGSVVWTCQCECGNTCEASSENLRAGKTKSCGCLVQERFRKDLVKTLDLTDQRFGRLTALRALDERDNNGAVIWQCKCSCGNYCKASSTNLTRGIKKSCGCLRSLAEQKIQEVFSQQNIPFIKEYRFPDLKTEKNGSPRFDFAVTDNNDTLKYLIEYQGEQHFKDVGTFGKDQREQTDQLKKDYCKKNNIPLYEIRYDEDLETALNKIITDNIK